MTLFHQLGIWFDMKHAFLITAYRDFESLKFLLNQILLIPNAQIYLNLDSRSKQLIQDVNIYLQTINGVSIFLKIDVKVYWGGFNHLKVFIDLLSKALQDDCEYFHTLTGQCRVTQSPSNFLNFFEINKNKSFIEHQPLPWKAWSGSGGIHRIKYYHLYDLIDAKKNTKFFRRLNKHFLHIQKFLKINRLKQISYWGGSGYFSINVQCARFLEKAFFKNTKHFEYTFCPEEIAPHTILVNAPTDVVSELVNKNLRFILWNEKNGEIPGILDETCLINVLDRQYFFARKFDSRYSQLLDKWFK